MKRETSIEAFNKIKNDGLLSKRRFEVYEALFKYGPMTANELIRYYRDQYPESNQTGWNARFSELEKLGVIVEVGKKADTVSGNECTLWDVTSNLPSGKIDHNIKKKLTPRLIEKIVSLGKKVPSEWKPHLREIYQIAKQI